MVKNPLSMTPATAPMVFIEYIMERFFPKPLSLRVRWLTSTGNVPPMSVVGIKSTANEITAFEIFTTAMLSPEVS